MRKQTIQHPAAKEEWRENFRNTSMKIGFQVSLSKAMLEMLCAIADGVTWDRGIYRTIHCPDNWIASEHSLMKRGLIRRKPQAIIDKEGVRHLSDKDIEQGRHHESSCCELTPAGETVVQLLKHAGLFVEQDAAITKKFRKQRA